MPEPHDEPVHPYFEVLPYLKGEDALDWFSQLPGGNHILDAHFTALGEVFGPNSPYRIRASVNPSTGDPHVLIFEVNGPVDDERSWQAMEALQERILELEDKAREELRMEEPFKRIVVSLGGAPSNWNMLSRTLEEGD
ncbi:hypothetical protein J2S43_000951 [Catenuloplanes nepalensis]|uniref:Uncharacterized protein n=1 Tax=Catenuloplanes nepalensis TaxID=587533 RepID=A0ABT9MM22_9ACTN|nr:hypothetical protein [Catenuloplanes nepalensis]MDP9792439.1 hypothetical protein [Catenuloplanes nepalensis]